MWHAVRDEVTRHVKHMMMRVRLLSLPPEKYWKHVLRVHEILSTNKLRTFLASWRQKACTCSFCAKSIRSKVSIWRFHNTFSHFQPYATSASTAMTSFCAKSVHSTTCMPISYHIRYCATNCNRLTICHDQSHAKSALEPLLRCAIRLLTKALPNHLQQQPSKTLNRIIADVIAQEKKEKEEKLRQQMETFKQVSSITNSLMKATVNTIKAAKDIAQMTERSNRMRKKSK